MTFVPSYPTVPAAALKSPALYELLVLVDAIRGGSPREKALAIKLLDERLPLLQRKLRALANLA